MRRPFPEILALGIVFLSVLPARHIGFLADDYYMGDRIGARLAAHPGFFASLDDAFRFRWTDEFDVFRPLTILTLQLDYALFGVVPGLHHFTNILLWCLAALLFGRVAAHVLPGTTTTGRAVLTLIFGTSPACIEALGWLVAREDILAVIGALLALRVVVSPVRRGWLLAAAMTPAFLAKETAIVLPPLLLWTDVCLNWRVSGRPADRMRHFAGRHGPPFFLLGAYFLLRLWLFGRFGGTYAGRSYVSFLARDDIVTHITTSVLESLERLVAPINHAALDRITGIPAPIAQGILATLALFLLFLGFRARGARVLLLALAFLPWMIGPLALLVVPLKGVGPDLDLARFLLIPLVGWTLLLGSSIGTLTTPMRRAAIIVCALHLVLAGLTLRLNLDAYHRATETAVSIVADVTTAALPGDRVLLLRAAPDGEEQGLREDLIFQEGVHLLSAGLYHAVHQPFVPAPGIRLVPIPHLAEPRLAELAVAETTHQQPVLIALEPRRGSRPVLRRLGGGAPCFPDSVRLDPPHGSRLTLEAEPLFVLHREAGVPQSRVKRIRLAVRDLDLNEAIAERIVDESTGADVKYFEFHGRDFRLRAPNGELSGLPLDARVLRALPSPVLIWEAELEGADGIWRRTPYAIVGLPGHN